MTRQTFGLWALVLGYFGSACAGAAPPAAVARHDADPAVIDALFETGRRTERLDALIEQAELAPGEAFKTIEIGRDAHSSHHVVALRGAEPLHRHDRHDLFAVLLEGHGDMLIGDARRPLGPRSLTYVPRGAVHSMRSLAETPAFAYVVFVPPFDGEDRVLVEASEPSSH